jgi:NitT/TauT family transport system substrate-binding protein
MAVLRPAPVITTGDRTRDDPLTNPFALRSAALLLAFLGPATARGGDADLARVRVATSPFLSWAPLFIGDAEACFRRRGIEVEFIRMTGNVEALPALVAGQIDVVPGLLAPGYFNLMSRGADIRFVADKGHVESEGCCYRGILARRDLVEEGKLDSLPQLRGLRIAAERTAVSYYDVDRLLAAAGLTSDDVELIDVSYAAKLEAFEQGAIDVATASEPWLTMILDAGRAVLWKSTHELIPDYQHSFILFGPRLLNEDRDVGVRFVTAYLDAVRLYNQGKTDRNVEIIATQTGLSRDIVARACWVPIRDDGAMNVESVLEYEEWAHARGLLDEVVPVERFWSPFFIDEAGKRLRSGE